MLSRVAECIFWMSRYIERAENVARFIDVNQNLMLDLDNAMREQWEPLVFTAGDQEDFSARYDKATRHNVLHFLTFDEENPNSILSCVARARENARTVRENISSAMWEEINKFHLFVLDGAKRGTDHTADFVTFYDSVKSRSHLLIGVTDTTMSHSEGWHFARLGRLLERADKTSRILDVKYYLLLPKIQDVGTPLDIVQWSALLQSASALEMYRKSHGRLVPSKVADFLILDRAFPRSMRFCLIHAENSLHNITETPIGTFSNRSEQLIGRLRAELDYTLIDDIIARGLHEFIDDFQMKLNQVGQSIYDNFFALRKVSTSTAPMVQRQDTGKQSQTQTQSS
ncbi:A putative alpha-helical domain with a conserved ER motif family protein [Planctomycetales bacterium 10988]|nr:A putative alpha-helical domain with a conserved ER motif family protein [Planctomycetales bacterium 10988]